MYHNNRIDLTFVAGFFFLNMLFIFRNIEHFTVLHLQTDFEKDVDIACRSGKGHTLSKLTRFLLVCMLKKQQQKTPKRLDSKK